MSNKTENTLKKGICLNCGEPLSLETSQGYCSRECVEEDGYEEAQKDVEETEITWTGSDDDLTAVVGEYELWVYVYPNNKCIWYLFFGESNYRGYEPTKEAAQRAAEEAYFKHLKSK